MEISKWFIRFAWMALAVEVFQFALFIGIDAIVIQIESGGSAAILIAVVWFIHSLAGLVVFVTVLVLGMVWVYWVNRNSWVLRRSNMKFRPVWSVVWWFIPIANFVQSYRITCELWRANLAKNDAADWRGMAISPLVRFWWLLFIVSTFAGATGNWKAEKAFTVSDLFQAEMFTYVSFLTGFVMWYLTIRLVREIQAGQNRLATAAVF